MSAVAVEQTPTTADHIDRALAELTAAKGKLAALSLAERITLLEDCLERCYQLSREWVDAACEAKGLAPGNPLRAEEIAAGPVATARHLQLLIHNFKSLAAIGHIKLPGTIQEATDGSLGVQVMPVAGLFDPLVFAGFKARAWLDPEIKRRRPGASWAVSCSSPARRAPCWCWGRATCRAFRRLTLSPRCFKRTSVVLLKMNPVNEYLGPIFASGCSPADRRRASCGSFTAVRPWGLRPCEHPQVDEVHITGSIYSHDAIVWGPAGPERERRKRENDPLLKKPITSELGNVSPWIVVPGNYTPAQLRFQAESVAASITNNASFNCVATKMIVTSKKLAAAATSFWTWSKPCWPRCRRAKHTILALQDRFARFSGQQPPPGDALPWTLLRDADIGRAPLSDLRRVVRLRLRRDGVGHRGRARVSGRAVEFANDQAVGHARAPR